jgi:hypothetical protein
VRQRSTGALFLERRFHIDKLARIFPISGAAQPGPSGRCKHENTASVSGHAANSRLFRFARACVGDSASEGMVFF